MNENETIRKSMEQIGNRLREIGYTYNDFFKMCKLKSRQGELFNLEFTKIYILLHTLS